jgi:hypothetical protein
MELFFIIALAAAWLALALIGLGERTKQRGPEE